MEVSSRCDVVACLRDIELIHLFTDGSVYALGCMPWVQRSIREVVWLSRTFHFAHSMPHYIFTHSLAYVSKLSWFVH